MTEPASGAEARTVWLRHLSEEELERGIEVARAPDRAVPTEPAADAAAVARAHERAKQERFEPEE
jgi:hypothetical protein